MSAPDCTRLDVDELPVGICACGHLRIVHSAYGPPCTLCHVLHWMLLLHPNSPTRSVTT